MFQVRLAQVVWENLRRNLRTQLQSIKAKGQTLWVINQTPSSKRGLPKVSTLMAHLNYSNVLFHLVTRPTQLQEISQMTYN